MLEYRRDLGGDIMWEAISIVVVIGFIYLIYRKLSGRGRGTSGSGSGPSSRDRER